MFKLYILDTPVYADRHDKKNRFGFLQERIIVITDKAVYNIKGKTLKRTFLVDDLVGLTKTSRPSRDLTTFTLHHKSQHDYNLYHNKNRDLFISMLQKVYYFNKGGNLPIYVVQTDNLSKYTTTTSDIKKSRNRHPPACQRDFKEDLF